MNSLRNSWLSRVGIVVLAAAMVEILSIVQYNRVKKALLEETELRSRVVMNTKSEVIQHALDRTEITMRENFWNVKRSMAHPDSVFSALVRLIDDDPDVVGGCLAFRPDFYPSKGRLFEPYASIQPDGSILVEQIAGPDHDYTLGPDFQRALREESEFWSDPYAYGTDPVQQLTTYTYPIRDRAGRLAAICGMDIDLTWLSDTLNVNPYYPSSFGFLLTRSGQLVAGPREEDVPPETVDYVAGLVMDPTVERTIRGRHRVNCIVFQDPVNGEEAYLDFKALPRDPGWIVAEVSYRDEVLAPVRPMMWRIMLMALAGLAFLLFILDRFARNGKRLWEADVKQARIGSELRVARRIQEEMLPKSSLDRSDLTARGSLAPAKEVGGDLFDYFVREGKLFFCVGDVCGKGVPAAMVMAVTHAILRMLSEQEEAPARIVGELNREACRNNATGTFVTLFLGVLDLSTGRLRYCNAGHDRPILVGASVEELPALANVPVGVFDDFTYQEQEAMVAADSLLFLYTDGVTESKDVDRQQYGRERLLGALSACPRQSDVLIQAVGADVRAFAGEAEQSDDITMLAVHYHPKENAKG